MKNTRSIQLGLIGALLAVGGAAEASLISVNLYSRGKPPAPTVWDDPANITTLTLEDGESAGFWDTTAWQNVDFGNPFSTGLLGPVALSGTEGSTATLQVINRRNSGPWGWNEVRDDSDAVSIGNATLLDGHTNGTEVDNNGANPFPTKITDIEVQDITFPAYDVIVYIGANSGQFFDGTANIRVNGEIPADEFDQTGGLDFTLLAGEPDGTLDEITGNGDTGNYVVYSGLTDPTFRTQVWGNGFNHIGVSGIQIMSSAPGIPFAITEFSYSPSTNEVTLTWTSRPDTTYAVKFSNDMSDWNGDLDDGVLADDGPTTTRTFSLTAASVGEGDLFFRIEEVAG